MQLVFMSLQFWAARPPNERPAKTPIKTLIKTLFMVALLAARLDQNEPIQICTIISLTLIIIKPTNAQLLMQGRDLASAETRALLEKWGSLHAVRSVSSLAASLIFLATAWMQHA
ncbi:DUF1772 domain-containing protein [Paraburkholderia sp. PGU19]|uniref:DUF1772 domain-containing protein n=1 Tax=Paraburkholderia sp. PGU19 TaxID=2735434 RepID=UPI0015D9CADF|nr:DUF1772 domain-containing protein [Paraburkholderia sp. PGU19]